VSGVKARSTANHRQLASLLPFALLKIVGGSSIIWC
jgi:hypothetical protein